MTSWIKAYTSNVARFIPAIVFLLWARFGPGEGDARWGTAYEIGGALALVHVCLLVRRDKRSPLPIGVDLYLIIGGVLSLGWPSLNQVWGAELGSASVLGCVLAVELIVLAAGWIDTSALPPGLARPLALRLTLATVVATGVAIVFRHRVLYGAVLPIIGLVVTQAALRRRMVQ